MIVGNFNELVAKEVNSPLAKDAAMKVLVTPENGWEGHVMRVVELKEGGYSPKHEHDWPHINYIIEGEGTLLIEDVIHPLKAGGFAYVPANTLHQFSNAGEGMFKFICIVPEKGHF
jgi:quercetin dioxygenase-like cupin family protein